jgi:hypothetical protein
MARVEPCNPVAEAVVAALNVSSVRALCPGGVSRSRQRPGAPPFVHVDVEGDEPDDALGTNGYGSVVTVALHTITSGVDADGNSRAMEIKGAAVALLDEPAALTVTGFAVRMTNYTGTTSALTQFEDGAVGFDVVSRVQIHVRQT